MSRWLVERLEEMRARGDIGALVSEVPYCRWLGISAEVDDGRVRGKLAFADMQIGNPALPALHGGTLGALLESTAIFELLWQAESIVLPKTISITVEYLRSGKPVDTYARASITKHGRRVVNVRAEAWQDDPDRPIASAHAHFLVVPA